MTVKFQAKAVLGRAPPPGMEDGEGEGGGRGKVDRSSHLRWPLSASSDPDPRLRQDSLFADFTCRAPGRME